MATKRSRNPGNFDRGGRGGEKRFANPTYAAVLANIERGEALADLAAEAGITPDELRAYLRRRLSDDGSADVRVEAGSEGAS